MRNEGICNYCGKKIDPIEQKFVLHTKIGYGSIYDGASVHLQLCCDCFDKIVGECKISPIIEE